MSDAGCVCLTYELITDGQRLGRTGEKHGNVLVADFLLEADETAQS